MLAPTSLAFALLAVGMLVPNTFGTLAVFMQSDLGFDEAQLGQLLAIFWLATSFFAVSIDAVATAGQTLADAGTSLGRTIDQFSRSAGLFVQRSAGDGVGGSRHVGGDGVTGRGEAVGRGAYLLDSVVDVCARLRRRGRLTRVLTPRRGSATAGGWRCRRNTSST
jgi:hypothetical protein